jgi:hypothetical protein
MGRYITTTGTATAVIRQVSSSFNATVNDRILADSNGSPFTITLPNVGSLLENDTIQIIDVGGVAGSNNITVARSGAKIRGQEENLVIDVSGATITIMYSGPTYGWIIIGT